MRVLMYVVSNLFVAAGLIIAFCYVLRSGRILKGILIGWGLSIVFIFLDSVMFPGVVAIYNKEYSLCFPEAIAVLPTILTGWLSACFVAIVAGLIRHVTRRFWLHSGQTKTNKGDK
jgi:hypothetical protein